MSNVEVAEQAKARGNQHFTKQEWEKAIEEYDKAIEASPNGSGSHIYFSNRSACYAGLQKYEEALADANQSVKLKPDFAKAYSRLGFAHFKLNDIDEAEKAYKDGLKIEPNNESLKTGLEEIMKEKKKPSGGCGGGGLFGPEIWLTIHQDPELRQYANDRDFIAKVNMLQTNPQMAMQTGVLNDPKISKLFERLLGSRFGGAGGDMPKDEKDDEHDDDHGHKHPHPHPHPHKSDKSQKPNKDEDENEEEEEEEEEDDDDEHEHVHNEHCSHSHHQKQKEEKPQPKKQEEEKKRRRRSY